MLPDLIHLLHHLLLLLHPRFTTYYIYYIQIYYITTFLQIHSANLSHNNENSNKTNLRLDCCVCPK